MTNDREKYDEDKRPYEPVERQLSNEFLVEQDKRLRDSGRASEALFPEEVEFDKEKGRIINPKQFIVAVTSKPGESPAQEALTWKKGNLLFLGKARDSLRIKVEVLKSRKSAPHGKRYVLLQTTSKSTELEGEEVSIYEAAVSTQSIGVIHTGGGSNPGGGQGHSGQSNSYGVNLLVRPRSDGPVSTGAEVELDGQIAQFENDAELGPATVAVVDSGIQFINAAERSTMSSDIGWDFVSDDSRPDGDPFPVDDHLGLHGTKICTIIKYAAPGTGILPIKVSNGNGALNLYDALCGLEYARTHGAKVVNVSWSFTANTNPTEETAFPLLLQAMRDLEESGIVVVAAAGNKSQYINADGYLGHNGAPMIYPACYSAVQCNVITVTTVTQRARNQFNAFENFSPLFVDTGALANANSPSLPGRFRIPGFEGSYEGSSFATPYVAAQIARVINASGGILSKRNLLHRLAEFRREDDLAYAIRDGGSYIIV